MLVTCCAKFMPWVVSISGDFLVSVLFRLLAAAGGGPWFCRCVRVTSGCALWRSVWEGALVLEL